MGKAYWGLRKQATRVSQDVHHKKFISELLKRDDLEAKKTLEFLDALALAEADGNFRPLEKLRDVKPELKREIYSERNRRARSVERNAKKVRMKANMRPDLRRRQDAVTLWLRTYTTITRKNRRRGRYE